MTLFCHRTVWIEMVKVGVGMNKTRIPITGVVAQICIPKRLMVLVSSAHTCKVDSSNRAVTAMHDWAL